MLQDSTYKEIKNPLIRNLIRIGKFIEPESIMEVTRD